MAGLAGAVRKGLEMGRTILVVEDEDGLRHALATALSRAGFEVREADTADAALAMTADTDFDVIISDIRLRGEQSGIDLMRRVSERSPDTFFIMTTAYASVETAVETLRLGAYDYIIKKPAMLDEVVTKVSLLSRYRELKLENQQLRQHMHQVNSEESTIVGSSPQMKSVLRLVEKVAATGSTVLITGESGTGKELIARAVHNKSEVADEPFVAINCAAIPGELLESELFGHMQGSFTGAVRDKEGLFVTAGKGTLFLDEIGEVPMNLQVKLLRAIEERKVMPVGATAQVPVNARIIAATNRDLAQEVEEGRFRTDLYYRLNVVQVSLPPLRERTEDIPALVNHFIAHFNGVLNKHITGADTAAMRSLMSHPWKGNVRELENVIERAMILGEGTTITIEDLAGTVEGDRDQRSFDADDKLSDAAKVFEEYHIRRVLQKAGHDSKEACKLLDISRSTLFEKTKNYGISLRNGVR